MLKELIEQFKILAPLQMPALIDPALLVDTEYTEDYALLTFNLPKPLPMSEMLDYLDEQMELILMYGLVPTESTLFGQRCCAYSNPTFGHMFKINAITNDDGMCDAVYVTIYSSLEYMGYELRNEIKRVSKLGRFTYALSENDILIHFF
jgi:hypothetical protein